MCFYALSFCLDQIKIVLEKIFSIPEKNILSEAEKFIFVCEKDGKWLARATDNFFFFDKNFYIQDNFDSLQDKNYFDLTEEQGIDLNVVFL